MRMRAAWGFPVGIAAFALALQAQAVPAAAPSGNVLCPAHVRASIAAIVKGDFRAAGKDFAPPIASQFPPAKIEQAWQAVQKAAGDYRTHGDTAARELDGRSVLVTPVAFSHADWDFLYACDDRGRITTARLMPDTQLDEAVAAERRTVRGRLPVEAQALPDGAHVEPLSVPSPYGPLRGALTLPAGNGPFPAVVLVGGSGPNDLDETVGGAKPFRDIADGLAAVGIASLRYEKRQTDYPFKMAADVHLTVDEEETDGAPQSWWSSLHDYDQVAVARSLKMPILILQGGSDFQVSPTLDFGAWKQALAGRPNVIFHLYPGLGHLFTPEGTTGTVADYAKPARVDPEVIGLLAQWIKAQPAR